MHSGGFRANAYRLPAGGASGHRRGSSHTDGARANSSEYKFGVNHHDKKY
jgi:hypothetical protein